MKNIVSIVLIFVLFTACNDQKQVDLIIYNADIYSVDSTFGRYESMAIKQGRIVDIGSNEKIRSIYGAPEVQDLMGAQVYPGFIDAHCHFYGYGLSQERYANLIGTNSFDEVIERVQDYRKNHPDQDWILGRGWDQNDWENQGFPNNDKLNKLYPDVPVLLIRVDGHAAIVNDKALQLVGYNKNTTVNGGDLLLNNDELTGVLIDNAADAIKALVPKPNDNLINRALMRAQKDCFEVGLTGVFDAGLSNKMVHFIDSLQKKGLLKMRMDVMLNPSKLNFDTYVKNGIYKTDFLLINSVKLYADGALGSRGACLLEPYSDDIHNHGFLIENPIYYDSICSILYDAGYQVNTHAIGDSAVRMVLNTYAKYLKGNNDRRWRIEHAQVVDPQDYNYFSEYKIIPAVNTTHATSDMYWARERLGEERIKNAYSYRQLLDQNGWLTNGSDFPVESINPIYGFYAAVARKDLKGWPEKGFQMENKLNRVEALKAMTSWAARGSFWEKEKGSLEKGKMADFVVLDRDIMVVEEQMIPGAKVIATYINGELVFSPKH